jgi:hypothetical protein
MNCKNLPILIAFVGGPLFFSCKNEKHFSVKSLETPAAPFINGKDSSVLLSFHPADNTSIDYGIHIESDMKEEVNDEKMESQSDIDLGIRYKIKKDTGNNYLLSLVYDQFKLKAKSDKVDKDIDASTAFTSEDMENRLFAVFNHAAIAASLSSKGNITILEGLQKMETELSSIDRNDLQAAALTAAFNKNFLNDNFFKGNIAQCFRMYPSRYLKVGSQWQNEDTLGTDIQLPVKATYELESIDDDGTASIIVSAQIETEDQQLTIQGYKVTASLDVTEDGKLKVDIASGLLLSSNNTLKLKGTIGIMGKDVPVKYKVITSVTGKKQ